MDDVEVRAATVQALLEAVGSEITDWRGNALDLSLVAGGLFSMRRHGNQLSVCTMPAGAGVTLRPEEAVDIAISLVAAAILAGEPTLPALTVKKVEQL